MNYQRIKIYITILIWKIVINCYFITNSLTCYDLINLINQKDVFSQIGLTSLPNPQDSFLSNIGLAQTNILSKNYEIKKIINDSDLVGSSILKSSIENALILYKKQIKIYFKHHLLQSLWGRIHYKRLKKNFNKNASSKNAFSDNDFNLNKNKNLE